MNNEENLWLKQLNTVIEENLARNDFNNNTISVILGISERQLYRKIKQITNLSPNEYIRHYRLQLAKDYLEKGIYFTVKEVSHTVGYTNVGYFQKQFQQLFGKKPLDILKEAGWR